MPPTLRSGLTSDAPCAIRAQGLTKTYGATTALDRIDLAVPEGAFYLLVGPNGAGKSSLIKILLDLVRPTAGTVSVLGRDARHDGPQVRANIGYVPERLDWGYPWLPIGALMRHHAAYFPTWDNAYAARLVTAFNVPLDRPLAKLSKGQGRRVHLALALAHRPALLLLDEPTDGLDPLMRDQTLELLADHLAETPTTVVLSTHHVPEVERLADHLGVLRNGQVRADTSRDHLTAQLRRYRIQLPNAWIEPDLLSTAILRRNGSGREVEWIALGESDAIQGAAVRAGATVVDVRALTLDEAALVLLAAA